MSYSEQTWANGPEGHTPLSATRLQHMEDGIANAANRFIDVKIDGDAVGDGIVNDTAAIANDYAAAYVAGVPLYFPPGTYLVTALPVLASNTVVQGAGPGVTKILLNTASSTMLVLHTDSQKNITVRDIQLTLGPAATGSTVLDIDFSFKHCFDNVIFSGQHTSVSVATYKTQTGVKLRNLAGDNRFVNCEFNNCGNGTRTDTIGNEFVNCLWSFCWKSVIGGDPSGAAFDAGIALTNCNFVGATAPTAAGTDTHIEVTGSANTWWLHNVWIEGCDKGIVVGNSSGGPYAFGISNLKVGAVTTCINIVNARQTCLTNIAFDPDTLGSPPTDLVINATNAPDGFAANLASTLASRLPSGDIPTSVFPGNWVYISRAGLIRTPTGNAVTADGFETLNNKALVDPKVTSLKDINGNFLLGYTGGANSSTNVFTQGTGRLQENGNTVASWIPVPASHTATGKQGQQAADATALYICYGTNLWGKITAAGWTISF